MPAQGWAPKDAVNHRVPFGRAYSSHITRLYMAPWIGMQWRATGATGSGAQAADALSIKWRHALKRVTFALIFRLGRKNESFVNTQQVGARRATCHAIHAQASAIILAQRYSRALM